MDSRPRPARLARVVIAALAAAPLLFGCARSKSWIERRKDTFDQIAGMVNGPIRALKPFHFRINPSRGSSITHLDTQLDACFEAAPGVERIERLPLPPDDQGKPIPSVESLARAAESFRTGLSACRERRERRERQERQEPKSGGARAESASECLLRCRQDWSQLLRSMEHVRRDADWVGVRIESILYTDQKENGQ
jgi:hypothetical protein